MRANPCLGWRDESPRSLPISTADQTQGWIVELAEQRADQVKRPAGGDKPVDTVHQAAVPWDQLAGVLDPLPALDERFEQIAALADDRQHQRHCRGPPATPAGERGKDR